MVTCSGNYTQHTSDDPHACLFAVETAVCNDTVGNISIVINVSTALAGMDISTRHTYRPVYLCHSQIECIFQERLNCLSEKYI